MNKCSRCYARSEEPICPACIRSSQHYEFQRKESESQKATAREQQAIARQQREEQQAIARQQREEQWEIARQQVEAQQEIARQQVEAQQEIARQQAEEQREIAWEQLEEQRQIAEEEELNTTKRKLLEFSIQALSEPEKATAAALIIIRSTTFSDNLYWFWEDLIRNKFLKDIYFKEALSPLLNDGDSIDHLDTLYNDADSIDHLDTLYSKLVLESEIWLQNSSNDSDWNQVALPKIRHYKKILQQRKNEAEQERLHAREQRAAKLLHAKEQQAALAEKNRQINLLKARRVRLLSSIFTFIYGAIYLSTGWISYHYLLTRFIDGDRLGPGSGPIAVGALGIFFLLILLTTLGKTFGFTANTIRNGVDPFGAVFWLSATATAGIVLNYWSLADDTRIQVAMLASVIILPMIPLVRELLTVALISAVTGLISFSIACLGGFSTGHLINWISTNQPIAHTKKFEENPKTSDTQKFQYAKKIGREATIDDKDGWSNLRKNPSISSPIIRKIRQAEIFYVIEANDDWCKVLTESSEEGWMHRSIIKLTPPP
jgi:hypothetical protein